MSSTFDRQAVMKRAWALFREQYSYPRIAFREIGRRCFNSCLAIAWQEVKERVRYAAIPEEMRTAQIERLRGALEMSAYRDARNYSGTEQNILAEIKRLELAA